MHGAQYHWKLLVLFLLHQGTLDIHTIAIHCKGLSIVLYHQPPCILIGLLSCHWLASDCNQHLKKSLWRFRPTVTHLNNFRIWLIEALIPRYYSLLTVLFTPWSLLILLHPACHLHGAITCDKALVVPTPNPSHLYRQQQISIVSLRRTSIPVQLFEGKRFVFWCNFSWHY